MIAEEAIEKILTNIQVEPMSDKATLISAW